MHALLDNRFAPTTHMIGFFRASMTDVRDALRLWRQRLGRLVSIDDLQLPLENVLNLVSPTPSDHVIDQELVVQTQGEWTAYFNNGHRGTDALSPVGHLTRVHQWEGLIIKAIPHDYPDGSMGSTQLILYDALIGRGALTNTRRAIYCTYDGDRWRFGTSGKQQSFERSDQYSARQVRHRFTVDLLAEYCRSMGLFPFDPEFYSSRSALVRFPFP